MEHGPCITHTKRNFTPNANGCGQFVTTQRFMWFFLCASISTNFKSTSSSSACDASKWILIALNIHNKNNNNISKNSLIYSGKKNDDKLCTKKWLNWDIARDERETSDRHQICIWLVQSRWIWACRILNEFNGGFDR